MSVRVSPELAPHVRAFARDFGLVTRKWIDEGWHTAEEVEEWRVEIRKIFESGVSRDVLDVCNAWRGYADQVKKG